MDLHLYGLFILTGMSMAFSPGPSVIYTVLSTWTHGKRNMRSRVAGQVASLIVFGAVSFLGVGALMERFPDAIPILAAIGALYLGYIAASQFSLAHSTNAIRRKDASEVAVADETSQLLGFREGLFVGLSNPKIMFVYLIIVPQFTSSSYDVSTQLAVLIGSQWIIKSSALLLYVQLSDRLTAFVQDASTRQKIVNVFSAILLIIAAYVFASSAFEIFYTM